MAIASQAFGGIAYTDTYHLPYTYSYGYAPTYTTYAAPYATTYSAPAVSVHKTVLAPAVSYNPIVKTISSPYYGFGYGTVYAPLAKK